MSYGLFNALLEDVASGDDQFDIHLSIISNIKMIIESKKNISMISDAYPLTKKSIFCYGLPPAFLGISPYSNDQLCYKIEQLIEKYEPRLSKISVAVHDLSEQTNTIKLRIEGEVLSKSPSTLLSFNSTIHLSDISLSIDKGEL